MKFEDQSKEYEFLGKIAVVSDLPEYEYEIVSYCSEIFSVQSVLAVQFMPDLEPNLLFRWIPNDKLRDTFDRVYPKLGYMFDPFYQIAFHEGDYATHQLREIAPDRFESSDYFANYFGTTGMVDELGGIARLNNGSSLHLSFGRNSGRRKYRAFEVQKFKMLCKVLLPKLKEITQDKKLPQTSYSQSIKHQMLSIEIENGKHVSKREAEIAELIIQGHSGRAVSLKLGISVQTEKVHRRNLYKKLGISAQNELFAILMRQLEKQ